MMKKLRCLSCRKTVRIYVDDRQMVARCLCSTKILPLESKSKVFEKWVGMHCREYVELVQKVK